MFRPLLTVTGACRVVEVRMTVGAGVGCCINPASFDRFAVSAGRYAEPDCMSPGRVDPDGFAARARASLFL